MGVLPLIYKNLFEVLGGLSLIIYGIKLMGEGTENVVSEKIKAIYNSISKSSFKNMLIGTIVTAILQSSSATTVMIIALVNSYTIDIYQAAGFILGANIGTTITAQFMAINYNFLVPLILSLGILLLLINRGKYKEYGNILFGFSLIIFGMNIMQQGFLNLHSYFWFKSIIETLTSSTFIGISVGVITSALLQNSSASIGLLMALSAVSNISITSALPMLFGSNIGSCISVLLASIGTSKASKKAALIHLYFNIFGTMIFLIFIKPCSIFIADLFPGSIKLQIAISHILFNLINALILLLFIPYIVKFVNLLVRGQDKYVERSSIDDRLLETPIIAVAQTQKEILKMAMLVRDNVEMAFSSFYNDTQEFIELIDEREIIINRYEKDITLFLVKLSNSKVSKDEIEIINRFFNQVKDIERIGDFSETIASFIKEKARKKLKLSEGAKQELMEMYKLVTESFNLCIEILKNKDIKKCNRIIEIEKTADLLEDHLRSSNIKRLNEGKCNAENSALFLDMVNNLERITDHSKNLAQVMLN